MHKVYQFSCVLLCLALVSCASSTPTTTQTITHVETKITQTPNIIPTESINPTQIITHILGSKPITSDNASTLIQVGALGYGYANTTTWSPDGQTLAVGTSGGIVTYQTSNFLSKPAWHDSMVGSVNTLSFSPDGNLLAVAGWEALALWNKVTGEEKILQTEGYINGAAISPDGRLLAANSYVKDAQLWQVWDVTTGDLIIQWQGGDIGGLGVLAFSPDGKVLASASSSRTEGHSNGKVRLWDISTGNLLLELGDSSNRLAGVAFSPDGKILASGGSQNSVDLWDIASGELINKLEGHTGEVVSVDFSPDGLRLASLDNGKDNQVHVWDVPSGTSLVTLNGCPRTEHVNPGNIDFSPDGTRLVTACEDMGIKIWDVNTGEAQQISEGYKFGVSDIAISPDGKLLAAGYVRNWDMEQPIDIVLWNLETRTEFSRLSGHLGMVNTLAFNPNGSQLASGSVDGTVRLWNTTTGESTIILEGYPMTEGSLMMYGTTLKNFPVSSLAFNQKGTLLAVGGGGFWNPGWLELYDPTSGKQLGMLKPTTCTFPCGGTTDVHDITFSPDGTLLASLDADGVKLWDIAKKKQIQLFSDGRHGPTMVDFSPDGKILAGAEVWAIDEEGVNFSEEYMRGGVIFWDVQTGERLDFSFESAEPVQSIAFNPDGKLLAVGHESNVAIWDMVAGKQLTQVNCAYTPVITFSPDGTIMAIGDTSGVINLWVVPNQ